MERYSFERAEQSFQALGNFGIYQKTAKVNKAAFITFTLPPTINDSLIKYGRDFQIVAECTALQRSLFPAYPPLGKAAPGTKPQLKTIDHRRVEGDITGYLFKEHIKRFNDVVVNFLITWMTCGLKGDRRCSPICWRSSSPPVCRAITRW